MTNVKTRMPGWILAGVLMAGMATGGGRAAAEDALTIDQTGVKVQGRIQANGRNLLKEIDDRKQEIAALTATITDLASRVNFLELGFPRDLQFWGEKDYRSCATIVNASATERPTVTLINGIVKFQGSLSLTGCETAYYHLTRIYWPTIEVSFDLPKGNPYYSVSIQTDGKFVVSVAKQGPKTLSLDTVSYEAKRN